MIKIICPYDNRDWLTFNPEDGDIQIWTKGSCKIATTLSSPGRAALVQALTEALCDEDLECGDEIGTPETILAIERAPDIVCFVALRQRLDLEIGISQDDLKRFCDALENIPG